MTYNELLHSVSFEEIAPYIGKYGNKDGIALYKTHYDMLRLLKPRDGEDDEKIVTISNAELYYDFEEPHIDAYPIEGCYWEVALAKEIIVEPDVNATWAEIAACCLWHTSFYGFTQEQREESFENFDFYGKDLLDNDITRIRAKRVQKKIEERGGRIPSKKEMMTVPAFRHEVKTRVRRASHLPYGCGKRKLARRIINRLYWERILDIGSVTCDFVQSKDIWGPELYNVFLAKNYRTYRFLSYAADVQDRSKWIWELITKYNAFYNGLYHTGVLCFFTSHENDISGYDLCYVEKLFSWFDTKIKGVPMIYSVFDYDDTLGDKILLSVVFYE